MADARNNGGFKMNNNDMNQDNELFERVEEILAAVHSEKDKVQSNHIQCIGKIDSMMLLPDEEIENITEYNEMDRMFIRHIAYLFSKMLTVVSAIGEDTFIDEHDDIKIMFTHWYALMTSYTVEMSELLTMYSKHYFDIHEFTGDNQSEAVKSFVAILNDIFGFLRYTHPRITVIFETFDKIAADSDNREENLKRLKDFATCASCYDLEKYRKDLNETINNLNDFVNDYAKELAESTTDVMQITPHGPVVEDHEEYIKISRAIEDKYHERRESIIKTLCRFSMDYAMYKLPNDKAENWTYQDSENNLKEIKKTMSLIDTLMWWGETMMRDDIKLHALQGYHSMLCIAESQLYPFKGEQNAEVQKLASLYADLSKHLENKTKNVYVNIKR